MLKTIIFFLINFVSTQVKILLTLWTINFVIFFNFRKNDYFFYRIFLFYSLHLLLLCLYHLFVCWLDFLTVCFEFINSHVVFVNEPVDRDNPWCFLRIAIFNSFSLFHHFNAEWGKKIYCFSHIVALRKPTVIGFEKCAYIISRPLISFIYWDSNFKKF